MIDVHYKARLGNNLLQYCFGRILAEQLGFALRAGPIEGFPNTAAPVAGAAHREPVQVLSGQKVDLAAILADRTPRRIVLEGWFQRLDYYRAWRDRIRLWLAFDPAVRLPGGEPDLVVNVRRTDYVQLGWALPFSYYRDAIEMLLPPGGALWIVTDDRRDPFLRRFSPFKPRFFTGTAVEQMLFMTRAPRLVMSASTFSWWPAFLGDMDKIVCPLPAFGAWSRAADSEVDLIDAQRFVCLRCAGPDRPSGVEAAYQKMRLFRRRNIIRANHWLGLALPVPPQ
jgi:hypothetical protein